MNRLKCLSRFSLTILYGAIQQYIEKDPRQALLAAGLGTKCGVDYIMPPMLGLAGAGGSGAGISVMAHSEVRIRAAMLAAF